MQAQICFICLETSSYVLQHHPKNCRHFVSKWSIFVWSPQIYSTFLFEVFQRYNLHHFLQKLLDWTQMTTNSRISRAVLKARAFIKWKKINFNIKQDLLIGEYPTVLNRFNKSSAWKELHAYFTMIRKTHFDTCVSYLQMLYKNMQYSCKISEYYVQYNSAILGFKMQTFYKAVT